ncbi:MAG: hypothetical protein CVV64_19760 [Candidatus Wallbacteria bacterium HGW-Wallbacteria-1]|uniref:Uncharacterized protein n=1 Tax=Candidatus Wallbacteria bacterium HGW-Wallbacteria-1 TaxID=2013854 RepID=A0A2N1PIU4_9BACT|nr:MAG: hypothetical protein CVV64_19760 [Candidatus Wallbacteria bacterium HGW-Wallbacteria-1]
MTSAAARPDSWTLHAPAEARRAFRDRRNCGGGKAAGVLRRSTGRGPRSIKQRFPFSRPAFPGFGCQI